MWIEREISKQWAGLAAQPVRIVVGPRQCGKSSFLQRVRPEGFQAVTLDDISMRDAASRDPRLFLEHFGPHAIIDEAQYAPDLFPEIKRRVDIYKKARREGITAERTEL